MGPQLFEALLTVSIPRKFSIFLEQLIEGLSNLRKVPDKSPVKAWMTKELPNYFYICWRRQFGNKFNFFLVNFNFPAGNDMSQHNPLVHHKMAFLLVKHQVLFNAPL